jgi:hypothetical protein
VRLFSWWPWQRTGTRLICTGRYTWIERDNYHILGRITQVIQSPQNFDAKNLPPKPKSMQVSEGAQQAAQCIAGTARAETLAGGWAAQGAAAHYSRQQAAVPLASSPSCSALALCLQVV